MTSATTTRPSETRGSAATTARRYLSRVLPAGVALAALMLAIGWLLTSVKPFGAENGVNRDLVGDRTPTWNGVTNALTVLASTPVVIGTLVAVVVALRLLTRRWWASAFVATSVVLQVLVFLLTTALIDRKRPDVPRMDPSPPTSSFPSGHTGAATALYASLALVLLWWFRRQWRWLLAVLLVAVPFAVAWSRMYRGMHHPSDTAGGLVNGATCVGISAWATARERASALAGRRR